MKEKMQINCQLHQAYFVLYKLRIVKFIPFRFYTSVIEGDTTTIVHGTLVIATGGWCSDRDT